MANSVFAEKNFNIFGSGEIFKFDPLTDGILLGTTGAFAGSMLLCGNILKINRDESPEGVQDKNKVPNFDREFMHSYIKAFDYAGSAFEFTLLAAPLCLLPTGKEEYLTIGAMYAETLMLAFGIKELAKLTVSRARPYMYFDDYPDETDWNNSFMSGHTTMAFTSATFTSYVFFKYFPESKLRFVVLGGTYAAAIGTGILRVASGNHFVTDVLTGAAVGIASGLLIPWLHTWKAGNVDSKSNVDVNVSPLGFAMKISY